MGLDIGCYSDGEVSRALRKALVELGLGGDASEKTRVKLAESREEYVVRASLAAPRDISALHVETPSGWYFSRGKLP